MSDHATSLHPAASDPCSFSLSCALVHAPGSRQIKVWRFAGHMEEMVSALKDLTVSRGDTMPRALHALHTEKLCKDHNYTKACSKGVIEVAPWLQIVTHLGLILSLIIGQNSYVQNSILKYQLRPLPPQPLPHFLGLCSM